MICPHCGYSLDDGVAFCIYCGKRLGKYAVETPGGTASRTADSTAHAAHAAPAAGAAAAAAAATAALPNDAASAETPDAAGEAASPETTGEPLPESAWDLTGDYPEAEQNAPLDDADLAEDMTAEAPVAPPPADDKPSRLHADDSFSERMKDTPQRRNQGSRKGLAAGILGVLLVAGIGVGALYVAPSLSGNGGGAASSSTASSSSDSSSTDSSSASSSQGSSSSSAAGSSSSAAGGSTTEGTEDKPETKRGSTLENAMNDSQSSGATADGGTGAPVSDPDPVYYEPTPAPEPASNPAPSYPVFAPTWATATSTSPTEGNTPHTADLVLDGIPETAWNTNEDGVGQSITITTGDLSIVNGISILGGYNKISYSGNDLYWANSRPCDILVEYEGGSRTFHMEDWKGTWQDFAIDPPATTTWIKITIQSVYQGGMYDDCCISDIRVY